MPVEALNLYEVWNLTRPTIPPRSRLYSLKPIGLGTPFVESLTGYIARLAEAHRVRTRTLVVHEILPLLGRAHLSKPVNSSLTSFWSKSTRPLNSTRILAHDWVQALESLTLRDDLRFLTLLTWADVLTVHRLQHPTRTWCPDCYQERSELGQQVYEPLLWTLKVITMCPYHRRSLRTQCPYPDCQASLALLGPRSRPGYCSQCERWLGLAADMTAIDDQALSEDQIAWQTWVAEAIGELLAAAPTLTVLPSKERLAATISICVQQVAKGDVNAFARELQLSPSTLWAWLQGNKVPRFDLLLRLCYRCRLSPLHFLTTDVVVEPSQNNKPVWRASLPAHTRQRRPFDAEGVRVALETVLAGDEHPPPPMREIARRLGYGHSQIYTYFPELCRQISARYLLYQKAQGLERRQRLCEEIRAATYSLHAQGIYPSAYRVAPLISKPGFVRHPDAIAIRQEVLREIGWED